MVSVKSIFNAVADPAVLTLRVVGWPADLKRERVPEAAATASSAPDAVLRLRTFDPNFRLIVTKRTTPIVGLIFLLVFFVWY